MHFELVFWQRWVDPAVLLYTEIFDQCKSSKHVWSSVWKQQ